MKGDIVVKVKLGSMKKSIENFGADRYLIKTDSTEHNTANRDIVTMLSRYMGIPENKIILKSGLASEDKVFQLVM
ncbi:MAG: hypothetical protein WC781_01355 [Candidatus Pacearchaeota archaeon]|jgi:uncharacterized protein YggU (UPF0235/DUF167 family)